MTTLQDVLALETALTRIGLRLPDRLQEPIAMHRAIQEAATFDHVADLRAEIEGELLDATTVGARVLQVATLLAGRQNAHAIVLDCVRPLDRVARRVLADEADNIIVSMRDVFDGAASQIVESHKILGKSLTGGIIDSAALSNLGPSAATAWQSADNATQALNNIRRAARIAHAAVDAEHVLDVTSFIADPKNTTQLNRLKDVYRTGGLVGLITSGASTRLNTPTETAVIGASARAQTEAAQAATLAAQKAVAAEEGRRQMVREGMITQTLPVRPVKPKRR